MAYRTDYVTVSGPRLNSNGSLTVRATIARVGVQEYVEDGKIVREYRPPDEVEKSAGTFLDKPITVDHPEEKVVTADNASKYLKGIIKDSSFNGSTVDARLLITHADAVKAALNTHKQLSCGYQCDHEETSGIWIDSEGLIGEKGKEYPYDRIQRNIRGNHVALVPRGRAGKVATIHNDSVSIIDPVQESPPMPKTYILDSRSYQLDEMSDVEALISKLESTIADKTKLVSDSEVKLQETTATLTTKIDALTAEKDALGVKLQELELKAESKADSIDASVVANRLDTWFEVLPVLRKDSAFSPDFTLTDTEIKKLYLAKIAPDHKVKIDSGSDDYINAFWDLMKPSSQKEDSTTPLKEALTRSDSSNGRRSLMDQLAEKRQQNFKSDINKGA